MMTQQLRASILTAPLAAIDRRALSQAWYSALHLARPNAAAPTPSRPNAPSTASATSPGSAKSGVATAAKPIAPNPSALVRTRAGVREATVDAATDRRVPRTRLARDIERAFLDPRMRRERSTFSVGNGAARVVVVLQNVGDRVRLVAICAPACKIAVARALADARFALASRGIALDIDDSRGSTCS
jgi:hypothetical protein